MPAEPARRIRSFAILAGAALVLAGCAGGGGEPTSPAPTATATAAPTPTPTAPALIPGGSAADNLPYFTALVGGVWAGPDRLAGRAYIDALAAGGFDKAAMEVTEDLTTIGNPADSIQFAVHWGPECLIGQVGPGMPGPVTLTAPPTGATCLLGDTRPIDW
jgi:hypothetical protein